MKITKNFGPNLRKEIDKKGYKTYKKAAEAFEISLSYLNQLMRNEREPSMELLGIICDELGISANELLGDRDESASQSERALLILEIQNLLTKLSEDGLELVKLTAENSLEISQNTRKHGVSNS